ncbi:hypothetical protein CO101_03345 [Candidatus Berkelbacteria bacterium CG_4_9_14_3_um_filter_39_23]|uniref:Uncharacterized protein n=2 Tax=Candidatus Berkelbacteria TaxID=1618330 RepID=A0A2M7CHN9_9BACT|nr:hypothetical protein [Candidatus Berkelbacteria bacterium]OIP05639.1 MAG: hypothetical protein AUK14_01355 [Candidatus Berkelbacteria bacterium CG2_30_39_44]PIR28214.1 MAG: hypothetical protein COV39_00280 [Candidatus Berkelbacteria bacterium CG11_big_fil_rev_8_21_14_0_20_40_23]PIV25162.1 MAG: hypothetical protein COS38_03050 [Candidatus Berkelbacteria bacterium CG03_land_8_20_14_0_80_40_36]PJB50966.1 MAG: hypothetical protein CO101_03345 [Candidatus Berkelbacteria bacterium CG_4_9_14_3_um_f
MKLKPKIICYGILIGLIATLVMPVFQLGPLPIKFSSQIENNNFIKGMPLVYFGNLDIKAQTGKKFNYEFNQWFFLIDLIFWSFVGIFIYLGMIKIIQSEEIKLNHPAYRKAKF